jgi:hypothetical protein
MVVIFLTLIPQQAPLKMLGGCVTGIQFVPIVVAG